MLTKMIWINLQKAFDTINHKRNTELFRCYLSKQIFLVDVKSNVSDFRKTFCGVRQGSILGTRLLSIYVNDMVKAVKLTLLLYEDD